MDDDGKFVAADRPISIRALKRFACEQAGPETHPPAEVVEKVRHYVPEVCADVEELAGLLKAGVAGQFTPATGQRIAVIGAGPAGLSAAHDLALMGFKPVVFETEPVAAGMLAVGVPAYRLPRELIQREVEVIKALGVELRCGVTVGKDISFEQLRKDFAAVIVAVGAKSSRALGLPGERGPRVFGGVDLLRSVSLGEPIDIGQEVVVIGGGNVAYDVARTVMRQIAYDTARTAARLPGTGKVYLVSLETLEEMPADTVEIVEGDEEGITRRNGWGPLSIERDPAGNVTGVTFRKCERVFDEQRKFNPVFNDAVRETIPCDTVLLSVGQAPNLSFISADVEQMRPGWPKVDKVTQMTTAPGVFVAGDLAHGTRLLIDAVASGKSAARSVYKHLTGRTITLEQTTAHVTQPLYKREQGYEAIRRVPVPVIEPEERLEHPDKVVESGYTREQAMREASRCLDCGVTPVFDGERCVLCGGCADVCPTQCLKLVALADLNIEAAGMDRENDSAILKDEDRCIRCALCAWRCPVEAISMERVCFTTQWRTA